MLLDTLATIQERTHTHYIYKYKGREAAEVGGHAVQEITTRGHPEIRRRAKRIMQHMLFRLSVSPVVPVVPVMGAETMGRKRRPDHSQPPRLCLVAAHDPGPPDRS